MLGNGRSYGEHKIMKLIRDMRGNGCCNPSWLLTVKFGTGRCSATVSHVIDTYMDIYIYMCGINH